MVDINYTALGQQFALWTHNDIEHLFKLLLIICITSFVKGLFMYHIHFGIA